MQFIDLCNNNVCENLANIIRNAPQDDIPKIIFGNNSPIYYMALWRILHRKPFNEITGYDLKNSLMQSICENGYFQIKTTYNVDCKDVPDTCMMDNIPNIRIYQDRTGEWKSAIPVITYVYPEDSILQDVVARLRFCKKPTEIVVRVVNTNLGTPSTINCARCSVESFDFNSWLVKVYAAFISTANPYRYWLEKLKEPKFDSILSFNY